MCTLVKQSLKFKFIYHKEIIPGKIQAIKLTIDDRDIVSVNIYGPNTDDDAFFFFFFFFFFFLKPCIISWEKMMKKIMSLVVILIQF